MLVTIPTYFLYRREGKSSVAKMTLFNLETSDLDLSNKNFESRDQLNAVVKVNSIDFIAQTMKLTIRFSPTGKFATKRLSAAPGTLELIDPATNKSSSVSFAFRELGNRTFHHGNPMGTMNIVLSLFAGDLTDFPFDTFEALAYMTAEFSFAPDEQVPIGLAIDATIQNFKVYAEITPPVRDRGNLDQTFMLSFSCSRATTSKVFAIFILLLILCLAMVSMAIVIDIIMRKRPLQPQLLGMFISMNFALPSLRNSIPGAPAIGATIDVLVFFWSIMVTSLGAFILLCTYIIQYQDKKMKMRQIRQSSVSSAGSNTTRADAP